WSSGAGTSVATTNVNVTVTDGAGGVLDGGATLTMHGGIVRTIDNTASPIGAYGFLIQRGSTGTGGDTNNLRLTNIVVRSAEDAFHVNNSVADIRLSGSFVRAKNDMVLQTTGGGTTAFNAKDSNLRGVIQTDGGSTSTVALRQQTLWTM